MSTPRGRICVLADTSKPVAASPLTWELCEGLRHHGHEVWVQDPDAGPTDLADTLPRADLYVLKSGSEAALSLAGALERHGATVVNSYAVASACRDKIVQTSVLTGAGVPLPRSWLTTRPSELSDRLVDGPLVVKDPRGSRGRGVHVVRRAHDLDRLGSGRPWLAMRYQEPDGDDLKLYRIGDEVFGVRRPFPARTYAEKLGTPFEVDAGLRAVVERCGAAFGIDVYGVDVVLSQGRAWVVDMSCFPGFKGVPDAGRRLADRVDRLLSDLCSVGPDASRAGALR